MKKPVATSLTTPASRPPGTILARSIASLKQGAGKQNRRGASRKRGWAIPVLVAALGSTSFADTIVLTLDNDTEVNLWGAGSLTGGANPGYGSFPGAGAWPNPIQSPIGGDAYLRKVDNQKNAAIGSGAGGPFPSGSGIYYGGFGTTPNTDGGTLGVIDVTPVLDLKTVAFQIQIGQAFGYDLLNNDLSLVTLQYTTGAGTFTLPSEYSSRLNRFYNGAVDMPTGVGGAMQPEDIYVNLWGLQWDLTGISGITSFEIQFTGVEHSSLARLQLDQSSAAYASSAFPQDAIWIAGGADTKWSTLGNWQGGTAPVSGQNVTLTGGAAVLVNTNETVGTLTINAANGFSVNGSGGSVLTVLAGINATAGSASAYALNTPLDMEEYNLIELHEHNDMTIAGPITGAGFYKQGLGSLSLTGDNVYDGSDSQLATNGLIIRGGTNYISGTNTLTGSGNVGFNIRQDTSVVVHGGDDRLDSKFVANLLAATSKLVLSDGNGKSDLTVSGIAGSVGTTVVTGSQIVAGSPTVSTLTVDIAASSRQEFGGNLGGAGANENNLAFTKKGTGTQILSGVNSYAGATRIESGLLQIGSATALSANSNVQLAGGALGLAAGNYSVDLGTGAGQLQFEGSGGFAALGMTRSVSLNGGAGLTWGSGGFVGNGDKLVLSHGAANNTLEFTNAVDLGTQTRTVQVDNGSAGVDARLGGVLGGNGGLDKTGIGTVELMAANTYTGGTAVKEGAVILSGANGSIKGDVVVESGATLQLTNTAAANNTNRLEDAAKVTLNGSIFNFSNPTAGTTPAYAETIGELNFKSGANVLTTSRVASGNTSELNIETLTREKSATVNFNGASVGIDSRNKVTTNTPLTTSPDGFVGGWATAGNGFVSYGSNGVWTPSTTQSFYTTMAQNTWMASNNVFSTFAAGTVTLSGHRVVNSLMTQGGTTGGGKLWDLNGFTLNVQSGGIITFNGNGSNTTKFNNGTLTAGTGSDAELFVHANGATDVGATITNNGGDAVALVKAGSSPLTLTGNNSYTGGTFVNQGTLNIDGTNNGGGDLAVRKGANLNINGSLLVTGTFVADGTVGGTGALSFGADTALTGSGTLNQPLTIGSGVGQLSAIAPGNSPGQLNTLSETWAAGGSYLWEIQDTDSGPGLGWDLLNINGTLNLTANSVTPFTVQVVSLNALELSGFVADFDSGTEYSWIIATASAGITGFDASDFVIDTGDFSNPLALGGNFSVSQEGNSIALNYAVPEPASTLLLGSAGLWLLGRRRSSARA